MRTMKKDIQVGIRMPSRLRAELQRLAEAEQRSLASYIVMVLEKHVDRKRKT